jgi:hypothetical protein
MFARGVISVLNEDETVYTGEEIKIVCFFSRWRAV